jgi:hypothetical protein
MAVFAANGKVQRRKLEKDNTSSLSVSVIALAAYFY